MPSTAMLFHFLLLLLFGATEGTGGSKPVPKFYTDYAVSRTLHLNYLLQESKHGFLIHGFGNTPSLIIWDPVTQHKAVLTCPTCKRSDTIRTHVWSHRVGQMLDQNCLILFRGYICRRQISGTNVGCDTRMSGEMALAQLNRAVSRRFPFVLTYQGAVHTSIIHLMMTGVACGAPMQTIATQLEALYRGRYQELSPDVPGILYTNWAAPPGETHNPVLFRVHYCQHLVAHIMYCV